MNRVTRRAGTPFLFSLFLTLPCKRGKVNFGLLAEEKTNTSKILRNRQQNISYRDPLLSFSNWAHRQKKETDSDRPQFSGDIALLPNRRSCTSAPIAFKGKGKTSQIAAAKGARDYPFFLRERDNHLQDRKGGYSCLLSWAHQWNLYDLERRHHWAYAAIGLDPTLFGR